MNAADERQPPRHPDQSHSPGQFEKRVRSAPATTMTPFLTREDMIDGLKEVAAELRSHGVTGTMQLVGGAAIVLTVNAERRLTRDIDALLEAEDRNRACRRDRRRPAALAHKLAQRRLRTIPAQRVRPTR